ncbi:MAG: Type secretion system domain protein [Clostridia bacterium]|jgi:tight adherence protein C|nr:Type secretion system domain protein [Clostridia bacterium]
MIILITIGIFTFIGCATFWVLNVFFREKIEIQQRIKKFVVSSDKESDLIEGTLYERIFEPMLGGFSGFIGRVTPKHYVKQLDKALREAGSPMKFNANSCITLQIGAIIIEIIAVISIWIAFEVPVSRVMMMLAALIGITYIFPGLYLKHLIQERQHEIEKSLPDVIDMLTVSIEAGLGFDGAMAKLTEKMSGVLVSEFAITLKEMKMGISKRDALKSMVIRVPVADLMTFVGAIIQADQLGVSIGNVLRIQSNLMRQKRRQRASELAMKAPIKMLFPMVFFILPTIFIVLLGPVVIKIMETFSN